MATRVPISLACTVCGSRNYKTTRAHKPGVQVLEMKKYCKTCKIHTPHRETK